MCERGNSIGLEGVLFVSGRFEAGVLNLFGRCLERVSNVS